MTDQTKAEAAAYAPEIELLTRALNHLNSLDLPGMEDERLELVRRIDVLLDLDKEKL